MGWNNWGRFDTMGEGLELLQARDSSQGIVEANHILFGLDVCQWALKWVKDCYITSG